MEKRWVMIELQHSKELAAIAFAAGRQFKFDAAAVPELPGVAYDLNFPAVAMPGRVPRTRAESIYNLAPFDLKAEPEESTYVVRAEVDEKKIDEVRDSKNVAGVFSDLVIEPCLVCPGKPPLGTDADVEQLLCTDKLRSISMDGSGVLVAIVDTGINLAYLNAHGKTPNTDPARSWVPQAGLTPFDLPVDHGTMCAYDVCIAAPKCTLLDIALLRSEAPGPTIMSGFLSDAVRAFDFLIKVMNAPRLPGEARSLVVNNSWGMFHPSWDFPPGNPGNYSDNPNHPFNRIVGDLERAGADILFAAGNCGPDCPDGRCEGVTTNAIYGANGHPSVLCVAGVDVTKARVGYSTVGPGRLTQNKPDISGYTHFKGSGVYAADGGTSAATPVVSGVVAAVRSKKPFDAANPSTSPAAIRSFLTSTAEDLGGVGYDLQTGFGVVNGCELHRRFVPDDICKRFPWLRRCQQPFCPSICKTYPWYPICRRCPKTSEPTALEAQSIPLEALQEAFRTGEEGIGFLGKSLVSGDEGVNDVVMAYLAGYMNGLGGGSLKRERNHKGGENCGDK